MDSRIRHDYLTNKLSQRAIIKKYGISRNKFNNIIKPGEKHKSFKLTKDQRLKISNKLKKSHANGKHPGWSHINTDPTHKSYPERLFKKMLTEYGYYDRYSIEEGKPVLKYYADFAILDLKCIIEIDGIQHYRTESAIEYDKIRDSKLMKNGWKVYRIAVKEINKNQSIVMENLNNFIKDNQSRRIYNINELKRSSVKKSKYGNREDYIRSIRSLNNIKIHNKRKKIVIESIIDFSKFGWVRLLSKEFKISSQKTGLWMRKYMPEFYNESCFKRK